MYERIHSADVGPRAQCLAGVLHHLCLEVVAMCCFL